MSLKKIPEKKKILFLSAGSSSRSVMAEAILSHLGGDKYIVYSAGCEGHGKINPMAIRVLEAHKTPAHKLRNKLWDEFIGKDFDIIVTICHTDSRETCPMFPAHSVKLQWDIPDPGKKKRNELSKLEDFFRVYWLLSRLINAHFLS